MKNTFLKKGRKLFFIFLLLIGGNKIVAASVDERDKSLDTKAILSHPTTDIDPSIFDSLTTIPASLTVEERLDAPKSLDPFLKWLELDVLSPPSSNTYMNILGTIGFGIGMIAAYSAFPLAGEFAQFITELIGCGRSQAFYIILGINAAIPAMALNSVATRHHFQSLISSKQGAKDLFPSNKKILSFSMTAHALSLFAALSSGYVGYLVSKDFSLGWTVLFTACAYIGCWMFTAESQKRIARSLVYRSEQNKENNFKREKLESVLILSAHAVPNLNNQQIDRIYSTLFSKAETASNNQLIFKKLAILLAMGKNMPMLQTPSNCKVYTGVIIKALGAIIGAAETYVAYSLVQDVAQIICKGLSIRDEGASSALSNVAAGLACIPWACLDIEGVIGRFSNIYNYVFNKQLFFQTEFYSPAVQTAITTFSVWGGVSAAIPPTYLAIKTTENFPLAIRILISTATFCCPAAVLTEALNTMLNQGWNYVKKHKKLSLKLKRERIVDAFKLILIHLNEFPDSTISALYTQLASPHELEYYLTSS